MTDKSNSKELSTDSYKGVRDFYPEDMYIQNYIFDVMSKTTESFGYSEYSASILEPSELYEAKTGEEIVGEQTYKFKDRGERDVTLRPEMTPTIARMVANKKRELAFPLRWYSIPNLFRYERPQKGRLREHWQLNADIFGAKGTEAELEIIQLASQIMKNFGAKDGQFTIKINSRKLIDRIYKFYSLSDTEQSALTKLIDRKDKVDKDRFKTELAEILKEKDELDEVFYNLIQSNDFNALPEKLSESEEKKELDQLLLRLNELFQIKNAEIDISIMRGFDYYTGVVFEVFDNNPDNNRSLFGGGRYDDLMKIFGKSGADNVTAVGFGMGDVTIRNFLEANNLLPEYSSPTDLYLCVIDPDSYSYTAKLANELREKEISVSIDLSNSKVGDQIKTADKLSIPFVICIGKDEQELEEFQVKNLKTGKENTCKSADEIVKHVKG